jgi:hypothetical protein
MFKKRPLSTLAFNRAGAPFMGSFGGGGRGGRLSAALDSPGLAGEPIGAATCCLRMACAQLCIPHIPTAIAADGSVRW